MMMTKTDEASAGDATVAYPRIAIGRMGPQLPHILGRSSWYSSMKIKSPTIGDGKKRMKPIPIYRLITKAASNRGSYDCNA